MISSKGVQLEQGTVAVLSLDGTMVYVEEVTPHWAAVVAVPEQPAERTDDRVFTPGRVGSKKISPLATAERVVAVPDLSDRNKDFIGSYEKLRAEHGPNHLALTEEEKAAMTVVKVSPKKVDREAKRAEREAKKTERAEARAKAKADRAAATQQAATCEACDQGFVLTDTGLHYSGADNSAPLWGVCKKLMAKIAGRGPKAARVPREPRAPRAATAKAALRYRLDPTRSLVQATAANSKFADGNRGHKVYAGLKSLPEHTGTVAEVMQATAAIYGDDWSNNPEGVVAKALQQLATSEFGNVTEQLS